MAATVHLVIRENADHVRALLVVEPRHASAHVAFRAGQLDAIDRGSAGLSILAIDPPRPDERPEISTARDRGYALTYSEVIPSVHGLSTAVHRPGGEPTLSLGVSVFELEDEASLATAVTGAAGKLSRALR